ncbi:MAG TPA: type III pantothenate kinase [Candidatus Fimiplasma intestinipullorum]|uniref:Type III pantothenate kinase n=1 Tax=Candidatus Fimiplasma intestinipullorum TaxID=2840825 RepID=A0A9D1HPX8_9FIRM|nr:type III pantothenate kinase [Candidatus Fimiplasma intestinipullorum]
MLVAVDIGNTNITLAVFDGEDIKGSYRLTTKMTRTSDEYGFMLLSFLNASNIQVSDIEDVIVSTVVPKIMHSFNNAIYKYLKKTPITVGPGIKTGISIKTENPAGVGADRIVDAAGAYYIYGGPCLVIDFGTATTFDYINEKGEFLYGVTAPGLEITSQALSNMAAQLPEIAIKKPDTILAKNTIQSMQAGVVYGYIGLTEYIIRQMKKEIGVPMHVIATGGLGRLISKETEEIEVYDADLTFKGLKLIYQRRLNR